MNKEFRHYASLLEEIKDRIRQSQTRAAFSANAEMIAMYWDIGRMIRQRQKEKACCKIAQYGCPDGKSATA
jgi:hypothetical protein